MKCAFLQDYTFIFCDFLQDFILAFCDFLQNKLYEAGKMLRKTFVFRSILISVI